MIKITHNKSYISIVGHANYAPMNMDIVCAGVSALTQTLLQSLIELTTTEIKYDVSPGKAYIEIENPSDNAQVLMDSFIIGCQMIAEEYPDNVQVSEH